MRKILVALTVVVLCMSAFSVSAESEIGYTLIDTIHSPTRDYAGKTNLFDEAGAQGIYGFSNAANSATLENGLFVYKVYGDNGQYVHTKRGLPGLKEHYQEGNAVRMYVETGDADLNMVIRFDYLDSSLEGGANCAHPKNWFLEDENGNTVDHGTNYMMRVPAGFKGWLVFSLEDSVGGSAGYIFSATNVNCRKDYIFANIYHYVMFFFFSSGYERFSGQSYRFGEMQLVNYESKDIAEKLAGLPVNTATPTPTPKATSAPTSTSYLIPTSGPATAVPAEAEGFPIWAYIACGAAVAAVVAVLIIRRKKTSR